MNCSRWLSFLIVAVITSALAGRVREQADISASRMRAMRRLYEFTRRLSGLASLDAVAEGAASEIHASLGRAVVVLLEQDGDLELTAAWPPEDAAGRRRHDGGALGLQPRRAGRRRHGHPADGPVVLCAAAHRRKDARRDRSRQSRRNATARFRSARSARYTVRADCRRARARLARARHGQRQDCDRNRTGAQHAAGLDFARFSHAAVVDPRLGDQPDRLRRQARSAAKKDLLGQIKTEAEGLDEMVRNLLAITRIDAGALELRRDWIDLREIVDRVVNAARRRGAPPAYRASPCLPICRWCVPTPHWSSRRSATS